MSRCLNPRECDCPETDHLEYLKCGPCAKCTKRAYDMMSSLKTFASNISSKETEVLNAVHLSTLQPRNPETGPQSHHPGIHQLG